MATAEERAHAERLIKKKRERLRRLEEREAAEGIDTPPHVINEIADLRHDIAALEPIAQPPPGSDVETRALVSRAFGDGDWAMLFTQYVLLNTRMTRQEERTKEIRQEQHAARLWRLDTDGRLSDQNERARKFSRRYLLLLVATAAITAAMFGFVLWRLG